MQYITRLFIIYIPEARGIRRNITRNDITGNIVIEGKISSNPPSEGYINALLYRKNTWIKKKSLIFKTNNANSHHFGDL